MGNVLSKEKREQVIALGRLGWSLRRIEQATVVRRETASDYLRAVGVALRTPGGWGHRGPAKPAIEVITDSGGPPPESISKPAIRVTTDSEGGESKPAIGVTTGFLLGKTSTGPDTEGSLSACQPYAELIALELERGRNATGIWQDLVDSHGFEGGYQSVKRYVRKLRGATSPQARVVIQTQPGEECQVDYGTGPMVRDSDSGKYRRTRLFVLTLGYSRKSVRLLTFRSSTRIWAELHEKAFRRLGGCTRLAILDNLREGVLSADIYDARVNPLYRDVLAHYGVTALPCKVRDPNRKGKIESAVGHTQKTPLKGKRFESLEEAQAYLDHWEEHWAITRASMAGPRGKDCGHVRRREAVLTGASTGTVPLLPVRKANGSSRWLRGSRGRLLWRTPPGWIGRQVDVQWDAMFVRLLDPRTGMLLARTSGSEAAEVTASAMRIVRGARHSPTYASPAGTGS